jgi:succinate dehydrogenase/fumarate reductase flavoprotein subunit
MPRTDVDVVIVGSGAAGLMAALSARAAGARVLVAEGQSVLGGASRLSGGWIMGAGTEMQCAAKIEDSPESLYNDLMLYNQFKVQPGIVRRLAYESGKTIDWLAEIGVRFSPELEQGGPGLAKRVHVVAGTGQHLVDVLASRCRQQEVDFALGNQVDRLLVRAGAVVGVAVGGDELRAAAVVLATGGFGANPQLVAEHLPSLAPVGDWLFYFGPRSSDGNGLILGAQVGAGTALRDRCVALPAPRVDSRRFDARLPNWMLGLGPDGHRVLDETSAYAILSPSSIAAGGRLFGIFDDKILADNGSAELPTYDHEASPAHDSRLWSAGSIQDLLASGAIVQADTIAQLASGLGIPADPVVASVKRYNESAVLGRDRDFGKDAKFIRPIEVPPFYGVEVRPAALGLTCYGLQIDESGHVLSSDGETIEGLFAAGELCATMYNYMVSGNSLASCMVMGKAAGSSAAMRALAPIGST